MGELSASGVGSGGGDAASERGHLRKDAITGLGAATISMAFMGPATSVFFNTPLGAAHMGYGLPFGTLLALIVCFMIASTIGGFSRRMPTAGFAYTFNTRAFGRGGGFTFGWLLAFAYLAVGPMLFSALGWFGHDFLQANLSITVQWWVVSLVALALVLFIGSLGLNRSVQTAIVFLVLEVGVMTSLFVTILAKHSGTISLAPFNPGNSLEGFSGIGYGMLWGVLMFVGFESAGTLGEETHRARRSVPIALFAAVGIVGAFYVLSSFAAATGYGVHGSHGFASDSAPWTTLANRNWGTSVAWIVSLTVINSQFANIISGSNAAVRMMFSLGRERLLPNGLARTNRRGSPIAAWITYIAIAATLTFVLGAAMGPLNVYGFMGTVLGLGIVTVYISINLAFIRWTWVHERASFSLLKNAVIPIVASLLLLLPIWGQIHPYPTYPLSLAPLIVVALILSGAGYYAVLRQRRPATVAGMGRVWEETPSAEEEAAAASTAIATREGVA